jgi:hypothetical protein
MTNHTETQELQLTLFEAQDAWTDYLTGIPWDYFLTVTFRKEKLVPHTALNAVARTLNQFDVEQACLVAQPHVARGYHIHGLVRFSLGDAPQLRILWLILFNQFGRSKVEKPRSGKDVSLYCGKYLTKDIVDFKLLGRKRLWR